MNGGFHPFLVIGLIRAAVRLGVKIERADLGS